MIGSWIRLIFIGLTMTLLVASTSRGQQENQTASRIPLSADDICPIKVGAKLPPLTLNSVDGNLVDLNQAVKEKPTILIVYRGGWCVYCNTQMGQLHTIEARLLELGYRLIAVSADRPAKLRESLEKHHINYLLFSDSSMTAAQALGLAFKVDDKTVERYKKLGIDLEEASGEKHHILPVPAAFVLDADGTIKFEYVNPNYKVRVDPEVLLTAAKAALNEKGKRP